MQTLVINENHKQIADVFLYVSKTPINLHKSISVLNQLNEYVSKFWVVSVTQLKFNELTQEIAMLDKHCELDIYKQILLQHYGYQEKDILYKIIFSNVRPTILW